MSAPPAFRASVFIATSLDGFIARPDGSLDWLPGATPPDPDAPPVEPDPDAIPVDHGFDAFLATVDALLMGRDTFDVVRGMGQWFYGETPVYVLTSHPDDLDRPDEGVVRTVGGTVPEVVAALEADGVHHVYVDGGRTIQQLLAAGLVHRLTITEFPLLLGEGIPLFGPTGGDVHLELVEVRSWTAGAVQRTYRVLS